MIGANTHSSTIFFTNCYQGGKSLTDAFYFFKVFGVGVINLFKLFLVYIITRVHAHFFNNAGSNFRRVRGKMNISHQRSGIAAFVKFIFYIEQIFCLFFTGGSNTHQLCPRFNTAYRLLNSGNCVEGVGSSHGLYPNRMAITQQQASDRNLPGY